MNWKFWQNKKARIAVPVAAAAVVVAAVGTVVAVNLTRPQAVTQEQARTIALEHAGVSAGEALSMQVSRDDGAYEVDFRTAGRSVYEVEFTAGGTEYDYEIDSGTGEILSYDSDIEGWSLSSQSGAAVTLEQARELVVNRAKGLTAEDVRIREDWDDGRLVYEGEAWCNNREHEFEIDAATGEFLSWSVENR